MIRFLFQHCMDIFNPTSYEISQSLCYSIVQQTFRAFMEPAESLETSLDSTRERSRREMHMRERRRRPNYRNVDSPTEEMEEAGTAVDDDDGVDVDDDGASRGAVGGAGVSRRPEEGGSDGEDEEEEEEGEDRPEPDRTTGGHPPQHTIPPAPGGTSSKHFTFSSWTDNNSSILPSVFCIFHLAVSLRSKMMRFEIKTKMVKKNIT